MIDDPYEAPVAPELVLDAGRSAPGESAAAVLARIEHGNVFSGTSR